MHPVQPILDEWFGSIGEDGLCAPAKSRRWWAKDAAFDAMLRDGYEVLVGEALSGALDAWSGSDPDALALVLLLDQFTRNIYRDSPSMYAGDVRAASVAQALIQAGRDANYRVVERVFIAMPLMHSEALDDQERCVRYFQSLVASSQGSLRAMLEYNLTFAVAHRDIVARWGRFPHRNAILGRPSSAGELEFLKQPGSSF